MPARSVKIWRVNGEYGSVERIGRLFFLIAN
nr:MAG TPA: Protein psiB BINDING PROTEIN, CHAPERONE.2A [Caudoviricetes sp.]